MDKIERWIKRQLASAVDAGIGQWDDSTESALGERIYQVTDGQMTLMLSKTGFMYHGTSSSFECRYDEAESIELAPLVEIMKLRGDLSKILELGVYVQDRLDYLTMELPLRVYSSVAPVLARIVNELV